MDNTTNIVSDSKYHKLATEYSKLRAQASVLRKAVLEEQAKNVNLRENMRQKETALRRAEQEVDSLGFRNKQLGLRVAALQDEIAMQEGRKRSEKEKKKGGKMTISVEPQVENGAADVTKDALIFDELQKKIIENAQLTSLIDDKEQDLALHSKRILDLEQTLEKCVSQQNESEKRLRKEIETLQSKNSELETKLIDATSMLGSEDAISVSGSDSTPMHNTVLNQAPPISSSTITHTNEDRIAYLEKEISHWRTQYEIIKLNETFAINNKENHKPNLHNAFSINTDVDSNCGSSTAAAGIFVKPPSAESKRDSVKESHSPITKEQVIYDSFCKKYEDLLSAKYVAESQLQSFEAEMENLQTCLENATYELKSKDDLIHNIKQALHMLEEDLATTRINYEEQISVLTEQIISLSEQLASK